MGIAGIGGNASLGNAVVGNGGSVGIVGSVGVAGAAGVSNRRRAARLGLMLNKAMKRARRNLV